MLAAVTDQALVISGLLQEKFISHSFEAQNGYTYLGWRDALFQLMIQGLSLPYLVSLLPLKYGLLGPSTKLP